MSILLRIPKLASWRRHLVKLSLRQKPLKFLENHKIAKFSPDGINNLNYLNYPITIKEIKLVIISSQKRNLQALTISLEVIPNILKINIAILHNLFQKAEKLGILLNHFMKPVLL